MKEWSALGSRMWRGLPNYGKRFENFPFPRIDCVFSDAELSLLWAAMREGLCLILKGLKVHVLSAGRGRGRRDKEKQTLAT